MLINIRGLEKNFNFIGLFVKKGDKRVGTNSKQFIFLAFSLFELFFIIEISEKRLNSLLIISNFLNYSSID